MEAKRPRKTPRKTTKKEELITYSTPKMVEFLELTDRRIQQLADDKVLVRSARGKYDLLASVKGYINYLRNSSIGKRGGETSEIQKERTRLTKAQADKTELEIEHLNGTLVLSEEVEREWSRLVGAFRARCLSIPTRLAQELLTVKDYGNIESLIRDAITEALGELAEYEEHDYGETYRRKGRPPKRPAA